MAKRRRSAKQKANDRRLGAMARARGRKSHTAPKRKRRSIRKTIKHVRRRVSVARRTRRRVTHKRSITSKIPLVNNPTVRKVATGIGLATIGVSVIGLVAPGIASNPIVKPALAFLGGGIPGVIGQLVVGGGLGGITNIFGGSSNGGNGNTGGFA